MSARNPSIAPRLQAPLANVGARAVKHPGAAPASNLPHATSRDELTSLACFTARQSILCVFATGNETQKDDKQK